MKRTHNLIHMSTLAALAASILLGGCATMDSRPSVLTDARVAIESARANPQVPALAAGELNDAVAAYDKAEMLYRSEGDSKDVRTWSYIARQRAAIAQESANLRRSEQKVASATVERERIRLMARTAEADAATRMAQLAELRAEATRRAAIEAELQARNAQQQARVSQSEAENAIALARAAEARNAALETELRELSATRTDRGLVVTLGDVLFDSGSATLRAGGERVVSRLAEFLREYPERTLAIEGFTDSVGNDGANQVLSEKRASAVRLALIADGIVGTRIIVRGYGESFPVASNDTPDGRQRNRRVEIVISDDRGAIAPRIASYTLPSR